MANSSIITTLKNQVIKEIIDDETMFYAINSPDIKKFEDSADLLNTHIFRYNQNPETLGKSSTFITVQTHLTQHGYGDNTWVKVTLEFIIYAHEGCMKVDNIPKTKDARTDLIGRILDEKFNGRSFGYGTLTCVDNTEGSLSKSYLYRRIVFQTQDINGSVC